MNALLFQTIGGNYDRGVVRLYQAVFRLFLI